MKVTRIKNLCKAGRHCIIYQQGGRTLIGTRDAAYPSEELKITPKGIKTLFDWPEVEADITIEVRKMSESRMMPMSEYKSQLIELKPGWEITCAGDTVVPLMHEMGMYFVNKAYIDAAEKTEGYTSYHLSENIDGEPLIIVGDGLMTTAIIKPETRRTASGIRDYLERMTRLIAFGWPDVDKPEAVGELSGQITVDEMLEGNNDERENDADGSGAPDARGSCALQADG